MTEKPSYLYAYLVPDGIKIGTTTDLDQRQKSHSSAGISVTYIDKVRIKDKKVDGVLKKTLTELDKRKTIKNSSSTEVYSVTEEETHVIFGHIRKAGGDIKPQALKRILFGNSVWKQKNKTLREVKHDVEQGILVDYEFQRPPDDTHVSEIAKYIETNYMSVSFFLPSIIVVGKPATDDKKECYEVIDGMHRCKALTKISESHPCLNYVVTINYHENNKLPSSERINIFRSINKSKPMHEIYLKPNILTDLYNKLLGEFRQKFGKDIVIKNNTSDIYIDADVLKKFITMDNINTLLLKKKITGIEAKNIIKSVLDVNEMIYDNIDISFDKDANYDEIDADTWRDFNDFVNRIHRTTYKLSIVKYKKIFEKIRDELQLRLNGKKDLKVKRTDYNKKPFMFTLLDFTKVSLMDLIMME